MSTIINDTTQDTTAHPNPAATATFPDVPLRLLREQVQRFTSGSINRQIFGAATAIAAVTGLVKCAAMIREMVIAWRFGTRDDLDAFTLAVVVPFAIINVFTVPFRTAFLPLYIQRQEREGQSSAMRLLTGAMLWSGGLLLILTCLMVVSGPYYLPLLASNFTADKLRLTFYLLCAISPLVLFSGFSELCGGALNASHRFALVAAIPMISITLSVVLLQIAGAWGIWALTAGLVGGALLELGTLGFCLKRQHLKLVWPTGWSGLRTELRQVQQQAWPLILGSLLMSGVSVMSASLTTKFPAGSLAAFGYANKLIATPIGLLSVALNTAAAPFLARLATRQAWRSLQQTLARYLVLIFCLAVPVTIGLMVLAQPLTALLLQRGAFAPTDSRLVAELLSGLALQLPFYIASGFVVQLLIALRATKVTLMVSACNLAVMFLLSHWLSGKFGLLGIALSISGMYLVAFLVVYFLAVKLMKSPPQVICE